MLLDLLRVGESSLGTFGVLRRGQIPFALTFELPWHDNDPERSCIPIGEYDCVRIMSPTFGDTFEVLGVRGRSHILFHWGNFLRDTKGCILVGEEFAGTFRAPFLGSSKRGFSEFLQACSGLDRFTLHILECR